ncbi:PspC domain-containing protein [Alkalihalobacterium elongatum]|uniref:PspC domain-containing protein n=1 Tax=Alkalihalobacterium elongatum TaxID=2675466 RepID=UPI001C1FF924|nr:PspC domain-containing protein [Alkalihalobacterium elongatum]
MSRLTKSSRENVLFGVCGGIAEYFGISPFAIRLIFIFLPANLLIYVFLAAYLPDDKSTLY